MAQDHVRACDGDARNLVPADQGSDAGSAGRRIGRSRIGPHRDRTGSAAVPAPPKPGSDAGSATLRAARR